MKRIRTQGFTTVEILITAVIAAGLLLIALPSLKRGREDARASRKDGAAAMLRRIEAAKAQYAADKRKKTGDPVALSDLVRGGYLATMPEAPAGLTYHVGAVGSPVELEVADHEH